MKKYNCKKDINGGGIIEIGIVLGLITIVLIAALSATGGSFKSLFGGSGVGTGNSKPAESSAPPILKNEFEVEVKGDDYYLDNNRQSIDEIISTIKTDKNKKVALIWNNATTKAEDILNNKFKENNISPYKFSNK